MEWYVIHSKLRQEARALLNLQNQGYSCYLPVFPTQKLRNGKLKTQLDPLFSRYLFIQLSLAHSGQSWAPIRSTLGVSTLLMFGNEPARVAPQLIDVLRVKEQSVLTEPVALHRQVINYILLKAPLRVWGLSIKWLMVKPEPSC